MARRLTILLDSLLGLCPFAVLAFLYAYPVRARLALGYWPRPYHPDPKSLGFDAHHGAVSVAFGLLIVGSFAVFLIGVVQAWTPEGWRAERVSRGVWVFLAGYLLFWILLLTDPGSFFTWYAD